MTFNNCLDLFEKLVSPINLPYFNQPMVRGFPIPPESITRISKILDLVEPKWQTYMDGSNRELTARRHRLACANSEFMVHFGDEFVENHTTVGIFHANKDLISQAGRVSEFTLEFQKLHLIGQTRFRALRNRIKQGVVSQEDHASIWVLNDYFNMLSNSITALQRNYENMQALWIGDVFPEGTPSHHFFTTSIQNCMRITANTFEFTGDPVLHDIFISLPKNKEKIDPDVEVTIVGNFFAILKQINDKLCTECIKAIITHSISSRDKIIEELTNYNTSTPINNVCNEFIKKYKITTKKEQDYLKHALKLYVNSAKQFCVNIINFVFESSKTFPVNNDSKIVRINVFLSIALDRIHTRFRTLSLTSNPIFSIHHTLIATFMQLTNEISDPLTVEMFANNVRFEMNELMNESRSNPAIKAKTPSPTLLKDLEDRLKTFNFIFKEHLNLFKYTVPTRSDLRVQTKTANAAYANLMTELDEEEEDEKTEAEGKSLAEAAEDEIEPTVAPKSASVTHPKRSKHRGKPRAAAATPTPKTTPTRTVTKIATSPAKAPSGVLTDPVILINSIVKRAWIALGTQPFHHLRRMKTRIRIRVADAMIALDQVSNCMTAIFRTSHPMSITYLNGELNRAGYNFHDSMLAAAQLMKGDKQKLSHDVSVSAMRVFGEAAPSTIWTGVLKLLGFADRFAGFHPPIIEGELKASRETSLQKFDELVQMLILTLNTYAPKSPDQIKEIEKEAQALRAILAQMTPTATAASTALSPAAPTARAVTVITPDFFLPFQTKIEASLKNLTAIKTELEVEIKTLESDFNRQSDLTRALERIVSMEHLLRLAGSVPSRFQQLNSPEQWHLIYNSIFFATHYSVINAAWLRAIQTGEVIVNHDASSQLVNGFARTFNEAEMDTLKKIWNVLTAEMRPMLYLAHCKKTGKSVSPLVELRLNLQQLSHLQREWNELPQEFQGFGNKKIELEKLQITFMKESTALLNLLDALITKEVPDAIKAFKE